MCYTGRCQMEAHFGECTLTSREQTYLKKHLNIEYACLCPGIDIDEDARFIDMAHKCINEYRSSANKRRLVMLGKPGSGKSTIGKILAEEMGVDYISSGDIIRSLAIHNSGVAQTILDGQLAPEWLVVEKVMDKLKYKDGWVLDGFPRHLDQVSILHRVVGQDVIYCHIDISTCEAIQRLLGRGRADDSENIIKRRMSIYRRKTLPMIEALGKDIQIAVSGDDIDVDKTVSIIRVILQNRGLIWNEGAHS